MRQSHRWAVAAASVLLLSVLVSGVDAQPGPPGGMRGAAPVRSGPMIALLDMDVIFKEHTRLKSALANLRADMERAQANAKKENDAINRLAEQSKTYRKGSEDYKRLEAEYAQRQADLSVRVKLQRKQFMERESEEYYKTYQEMLRQVYAYCNNGSTAIVLRLVGEQQVEAGNPQSVAVLMSKPVIWHHPSLDITQIILSAMERPALRTQQPVGRAPTRPGVGNYR